MPLWIYINRISSVPGHNLNWGSRINEIGGKIRPDLIVTHNVHFLKSADRFLISTCILPRSAARSLRFTLTIFNVIASKVEANSEHLYKLLNYMGHRRIRFW